MTAQKHFLLRFGSTGMQFMPLLFLGLFFFNTSNLAAQKTVVNQGNWFTYFGQYKLSQKWGMHLDLQFRMDGDVARANQTLLRSGLQYYPGKNTSITLGFADIHSYNKGLNAYVPEDRIWEQFLVNHTLSKRITMTERFRLEQRFVGHLVLENNQINRLDDFYGNRFRYFNRTLFNLTDTEKKNILYFALQDEVFLNFGAQEINPHLFDQNRLLLAFGVWTGKHTRYEIGYMNQYVHPKTAPNASNNIVHLSILQSINLGKS
jgi:hypothetical protein